MWKTFIFSNPPLEQRSRSKSKIIKSRKNTKKVSSIFYIYKGGASPPVIQGDFVQTYIFLFICDFKGAPKSTVWGTKMLLPVGISFFDDFAEKVLKKSNSPIDNVCFEMDFLKTFVVMATMIERIETFVKSILCMPVTHQSTTNYENK